MEESYKKEMYFKTVYDNINLSGYHTTAVVGDSDFTPFAYSTGISITKSLIYKQF